MQPASVSGDPVGGRDRTQSVVVTCQRVRYWVLAQTASDLARPKHRREVVEMTGSSSEKACLGSRRCNRPRDPRQKTPQKLHTPHGRRPDTTRCASVGHLGSALRTARTSGMCTLREGQEFHVVIMSNRAVVLWAFHLLTQGMASCSMIRFVWWFYRWQLSGLQQRLLLSSRSRN
jgi:hypothetical protein